jgi:hypothetical protein
MNLYQEMYDQLFSFVTRAIALLQEAQIKTEELFISMDDSSASIFPVKDPKDPSKKAIGQTDAV